ncbi:hypothetical protein MC885_013893, partial [Smutsia gigantea]
MANQQENAFPFCNRGSDVGRRLGTTHLADKGGDGHHLQDSLEAVEHEECGTEHQVCPQHHGLPEQEVHGQQAAGRREDQAGGQWHLGLCQVALGAWGAEQSREALHKGLVTGTSVESSEHKTTGTLLCGVPIGLLPSLPSTFPSQKVTERNDTCGVELGFPIGANTAADQGNSQAEGTQPVLSPYCVYHMGCAHV